MHGQLLAQHTIQHLSYSQEFHEINEKQGKKVGVATAYFDPIQTGSIWLSVRFFPFYSLNLLPFSASTTFDWKNATLFNSHH
jgi:hypothetical protein